MNTSNPSPPSWRASRGAGQGFSLGGSLLLLALASGLLWGCRSAPTPPPEGHDIRFHLGFAPGDEPPASAIPMRLPVSGMTTAVEPVPALVEFDLTGVRWVWSRDESGSQLRSDREVQLRFELNKTGRERLYKVSRENVGQTLVLIVDGYPVGALALNEPIDSGVLDMPVEFEADEVRELAHSLRRSIQSRERARRGN